MEVRVSDSADDGNESIGEGGCPSVSEGGRRDGGGAAGRDFTGRGAEQGRTLSYQMTKSSIISVS